MINNYRKKVWRKLHFISELVSYTNLMYEAYKQKNMLVSVCVRSASLHWNCIGTVILILLSIKILSDVSAVINKLKYE